MKNKYKRAGTFFGGYNIYIIESGGGKGGIQ